MKIFFTPKQERITLCFIISLVLESLQFDIYLRFKQVRTGAGVSNDEILGFAKLFNDELTLDNVSRFVLLLILLIWV